MQQLQSNVERLLHLCNGGQESAANRYSKSLEAKFSSEGFRVRAVPHLDTINSHCGLPFVSLLHDKIPVSSARFMIAVCLTVCFPCCMFFAYLLLVY